jgi:hypothetical protein
MSDRDLIFKAAQIARAAPENWKEFLGAFELYTDQQVQNCISSPSEALRVTQGRAQACVALLRLFSDCVKDADQIETRRKR